MRDKVGFDLWAEDYDKTVGLIEESNTYPFAGYKAVLNTIFNEVLKKDKASVLDLGFGTGTLTSKLYEKGCNITGVDFSTKMIELAKKKMPNATLYQADFSKKLPDEVLNSRYDFIIGTYSLHHVTDKQKPQFIEQLLDMLKQDGKLLIGDVAFENRNLLEEAKTASGDTWDNEEEYFVYDEIKPLIKANVSFEKISFCAGVLTIQK